MSEATAIAELGLGLGGMRPFSDERLVRRAIAGDQRAFAAIYRRYQRELYRYLLAIVGNREDASDALQATMVKAMRALPGERREIALKPWLYRIAHNEAIDLVRRRRTAADPLAPEIAARDPQPHEEVEQRVRLRRLLADLDDLPERQRGVLVMRELSGLGFEEIATALGTSSAVARQALYEARLSLRQMETGRGLTCESVTRALSDADGRVGRRRDLRAHLRECTDCRRLRQEMKRRRADFGALAPLPAVAAAALFKGVLGGGAPSGAGVAAGGLGGAIGGAVAVKSAATLATVAVLGAAVADRGGVVDLPLPAVGSASVETSGSDAPAVRQAGDGYGHASPHPGSGSSPAATSKPPAASHGNEAPTAGAGGVSHHAAQASSTASGTVGGHGKPAVPSPGASSGAGAQGQATADSKKGGSGGAPSQAGDPGGQAPGAGPPPQVQGPPSTPPSGSPSGSPSGADAPAASPPPQASSGPAQNTGGPPPNAQAGPPSGNPPHGPPK